MDVKPQATQQSSPVLDRKLGYLVLRFTLGLSILMHGLVRLPHLQAFADGLVKMFGDTPLPAMLVRPFGFGLVFVETAVGLLVLLGYGLRKPCSSALPRWPRLFSAARSAPNGTRLPSSFCMPPFTPRSSPHASTTLIPLTPFYGTKPGFC